MSAQIVLLDDDQAALERTQYLLKQDGLAVAAFLDPMDALAALERIQTVQLLVTSITFPAGKPHGVSVAQLTKYKRRDLQVLFIDSADLAEHTEGVGDFLATPIEADALVASVRTKLTRTGQLATYAASVSAAL